MVKEPGFTARAMRLILLAGVLTAFAGCTTTTDWHHSTAYEYRYRVFESSEPMPSTMTAPRHIELLTQRFLPAGALNRAMDILTEQGFTLDRIDRIPDTAYHVFVFKRPAPANYRITRAPMEYTGVYQVPSDEAGAMKMYSFSPHYQGYLVTMYEPGSEPQVIDTEWTGDGLTGRDMQTSHTFVLAGDGQTITHWAETTAGDDLDREETMMVRIQETR